MNRIFYALGLGMLCLAPAHQVSSLAGENDGSIERYYCTQYGPFFIRFDPDKAAGVFAILSNDDLGSMVGRLEGRRIDGTWEEVDSRGRIRLTFSEDWSRFDAEYTVAGNPLEWHGEWTGYLRNDPDVQEFTRDGEAFRCG